MNEVTIYGPYTRIDGRKIIIVNGKTISYPRYLYEQHHKIKLHPDDTIDHKDNNFANDSIDNLVIKSREANSSQNTNSSGPLGYKQTEEHKRSGEKNGMALITQEKVNFYRREYESKRLNKHSIARETGLKLRTVENFLNYRSYK